MTSEVLVYTLLQPTCKHRQSKAIENKSWARGRPESFSLQEWFENSQLLKHGALKRSDIVYKL